MINIPSILLPPSKRFIDPSFLLTPHFLWNVFPRGVFNVDSNLNSESAPDSTSTNTIGHHLFMYERWICYLECGITYEIMLQWSNLKNNISRHCLFLVWWRHDPFSLDFFEHKVSHFTLFLSCYFHFYFCLYFNQINILSFIINLPRKSCRSLKQ